MDRRGSRSKSGSSEKPHNFRFEKMAQRKFHLHSGLSEQGLWEDRAGLGHQAALERKPSYSAPVGLGKERAVSSFPKQASGGWGQAGLRVLGILWSLVRSIRRLLL